MKLDCQATSPIGCIRAIDGTEVRQTNENPSPDSIVMLKTTRLTVISLVLIPAFAVFSGCAEDRGNLVPEQTAAEIAADIDEVQSLVDSGECFAADIAAERARSRVEALGSDVDRELKKNLIDGVTQLQVTVKERCEQDESVTGTVAPEGTTGTTDLAAPSGTTDRGQGSGDESGKGNEKGKGGNSEGGDNGGNPAPDPDPQPDPGPTDPDPNPQPPTDPDNGSGGVGPSTGG